MAALNKIQMQVWSRPQVYEPNTFIGGIGSAITSASALASVLGISETIIKGFKIVGSDVECAIVEAYDIQNSAFDGNNDITYYRDEGEKLKNVGQYAFISAGELLEFKGLGVETIGKAAFMYAAKLKKCITGQYFWQVGQEVFSGCELLNEIDVSTVTSFLNKGYRVFAMCLSLPDIVFNDDVDLGEIENIFWITEINTIDFGGISILGHWFGYSLSVQQQILHSDKVLALYEGCFVNPRFGTLVTTVSFPNATSIGKDSFRGDMATPLENLIFPKAVTLGVRSFWNKEMYIKTLDIRSATSIYDIFYRQNPVAHTKFQPSAIIHAHVDVEAHADIVWANNQGVTVKIYDNNGDYLYDL